MEMRASVWGHQETSPDYLAGGRRSCLICVLTHVGKCGNEHLACKPLFRQVEYGQANSNITLDPRQSYFHRMDVNRHNSKGLQ